MTRPTESILCSILIALVLSICGPTAWAGDDAANGPAIADDNEPNPPAARDRNASDKNVLAGPRTGADAVKRAGRGFSGKDKGRGAAVMQILIPRRLLRQVGFGCVLAIGSLHHASVTPLRVPVLLFTPLGASSFGKGRFDIFEDFLAVIHVHPIMMPRGPSL